MILLELELIATAVAGVIFLIMFFSDGPTRGGLWDAHPGVRMAARHIAAVTVVGVAEMISLALIGAGVPIPLWALIAGYGAGFAVVVHRIALLVRARLGGTPMGMRWLKRDGRNRAWRTLLQGVAATVLIPAGDAALQVLEKALVTAAAGQVFDWAEVGHTAMFAAITAAVMAVLAYLHRTRLDPSPIPSAPPPPPPVGAADRFGA